MKFLLCNIFINNNSIIENFFDQEVLKEAPFNAKVSRKLPNGNKDIHYDVVMIPIVDVPAQPSQEELLLADKVNPKVFYGDNYNYESLYSIVQLFKGKQTPIDVEKINFSITILGQIEGNYNITYTDGSFKKDTEEASYGVVKILEESTEGVLEEYTNKKYNYKSFSGKIKKGTNNIGELSAIKFAIDNFSDSKYQIIVSDSEYGIKSFREWFYTWRENNFKNYAKKPISNKELIVATFEAMQASGKVILFKWVKGHSKKSFNELCDELAKDALK
jgi:ribonuclease HI